MAEKPIYTNMEQGEVQTKRQRTCKHHQGRQLEFYCRSCNDLCCDKCFSSGHNKEHSICELGEIIPERKRDIQNFIEKTERNELVLVHEYIASTETQLKDNASTFELLASELKTQTIKLKEELDLLSAQTLSVYSQMEAENTRLLQTYRQDLEIYEEQLKQQMQECKTLLANGTHVEIYYLGCKTQYDEVLPLKPILRSASFTANPNPLKYLKQALGDGILSQDTSAGSTSDLADQMGQGLSESGESMFSDLPKSEFLSHAMVVKKFKSARLISSICHTSDGQVWNSYFNSGSLALMDTAGVMKGFLRHNVNIRDISVSPATDALWTCQTHDKRIMELVPSGILEKRFETKKAPMCLCVTASNHVIVGMAKHISKLTTKGKVVLTTLTARTKKPLVSTPLRISECPVTNNVAVIDEDLKDHGGEGKRNVVVMDTDFRELFRYRGEIPTDYQQTTVSESDIFICYGIAFDRRGNIVIADHCNNRILLLNGQGEFLRILHTDKYNTWAVSVNRSNVVSAVFNRDRVRLFQL
ncbi:uncharacterized protein LOC132555996 [Ylistrum balloti]|uniref:uncharacterized protein LOC132555996 n=1 Tax=Ylistrum balloti TaxID=509963 RepID=UPI0029058086|nr:uncharacterized protein LOC132555996 [Ylistrum balloti]